jgi:hypothetical protein
MTDIDEQLKQLCEQKGLRFKPWEVAPWDVTAGPSPWPRGTAGYASWPKAQQLRRRLLAELRGAADR